ncbi:selenide, water dikinase SelD [Thioclava sp. DLFJ5-1]|uniref:selenide, water dikinase SelD n=1 Tax=Thioclava sp. DLFJ5-1 TaxID=1915314 RepID=UPI000998044E|nr:selenide, water dikinase SelD [Thioclava sp. DLFJ5-1]OOY19765.1 selenide, water dikinase SelD [Thioclava sp. DLFJ5-1]
MHAAPALPLTRDIVLIGGGHTHALVLRMWGMNPLPGVRLTVINPTPSAAYSGMLPGHVAGHYTRDELQLDLVKLARHAGARLVLGRATGLDRARRLIEVPGRAPIAYDVASIDIGITAEMPQLPGFLDHVAPAKPLDAFADAWDAFAANPPESPKVAVVGGGVAGVELAMACAHRLPQAQVTVYEAAPEALRALGTGARNAMLAHCARLGVTIETDAALIGAEKGRLLLEGGRTAEADFIIGTGATKPADWLPETGLDLTDGFVTVGPTLQSSDPAIFAAGDIAHLSHAPRPKAGVYAVREAKPLFANLRAAASGGPMKTYQPQRDYLKLISTGGKQAVADKWGLPLNGKWLWRWKDHIDRKFMAKVHDLPAMPTPPLPREHAQGIAEVLGSKPMCGGCGAKLGGQALREALSDLPAPARADVLSGPGDDAAVLSCGTQTQAFTTDHVRAFTEDPWLLGRIVALHAMSDAWAMGAAPQAALAQVTLPRQSEELGARALREMLGAASEAFRDAGCDLVGGHTSMGAELTLGFTVTGLAGRPLGQDGATPGEVLILTKPLGTGVILAAEMAKHAPGEVVAGALESMGRSSAEASAILAPVASAMTDVTGFGLAGHLLGLCEASGVSAELDLAAIPLLNGAEALAESGEHSTLLPQNIANCAGRMTAPPGPRAELLHDPQTSGGLLASVPEAQAAEVLAKLDAAGYRAAQIGVIAEGPAFLRVR